jgi:formylmethanofuran dehydrogenase subunit E
MYDIYFDLNDMHQVVEETPAEQLSLLYEELEVINTLQMIRAGSDEAFSFDFDLVLPDDRAVIVKKPLVCEKCNEIYPYAEPNGENNSFRCYSCRKYG